MLHENYNEAIEHFANGLSLVVDNDYKLVNFFNKKLPKDMFIQMLTQIKELQNVLPKVKMLLS